MKLHKDLVGAIATPLVLGIIAEQDSYGLAIQARLNELAPLQNSWSWGLLYPLLARLERQGAVESYFRPFDEGRARNRKWYRITDTGRTVLAERRQQWDTLTCILNTFWEPTNG